MTNDWVDFQYLNACVWDWKNNIIQKFEGHSDSVYCVAMSPNGAVGASGGGDDKAFIWSSTDGSMIHELSGHTDSITDLQFNAQGNLLATASYDQTVKV